MEYRIQTRFLKAHVLLRSDQHPPWLSVVEGGALTAHLSKLLLIPLTLVGLTIKELALSKLSSRRNLNFDRRDKGLKGFGIDQSNGSALQGCFESLSAVQTGVAFPEAEVVISTSGQ